MIPVLLNLKGNLEMGLAARLSTAVNRSEEAGIEISIQDDVVKGNVLLVQFQALGAGLFVGVLSCALGFLAHGQGNDLAESLLIISTSAAAAFFSSAFTSVLLAIIIVKSRQAKINPDNVATPLANCLGDLSTMCALALVAKALYALSSPWISGMLLVAAILATIIWAQMLRRMPSMRPLLLSGWLPVLAAILISSLAGLAFERFVRYFEGLGLILTVANGLCGNIASIHAARMATSLQLDEENVGSREERQRYSSAKRTLLLIGSPIHLSFLLLLYVTGLGHTSISAFYVIGHMLAVNMHLGLILVWMTPNLVRFLWRRGLDPDTFTMPLLAASSDLSGTLIFISMFSLLWLLGDRDANVGT